MVEEPFRSITQGPALSHQRGSLQHWLPMYDPNCNLERKEDGTVHVSATSLPQPAKEELPERLTQPAGLGTSDKRGRAVVKILRELARDEDFEVFLTQLSDARSSQGEEHTAFGSSCRDYLDITGRLLFSNFVIPGEDVLSSAHTNCEVEGSRSWLSWCGIYADQPTITGYCDRPFASSSGGAVKKNRER